MSASSMLSGFIYRSITGTVYKTAQNVYPRKVNTHTWNTVKPALLLEDQLMLDKKAPRRSTSSALKVNTPVWEGPASVSTEGPAVPERARTHTDSEQSPGYSVLLIIIINCSQTQKGQPVFHFSPWSLSRTVFDNSSGSFQMCFFSSNENLMCLWASTKQCPSGSGKKWK